MTAKFKIPQSTLDEQFNASDPSVSAWVSANAGSGKTHVLTQRVIRLMLAGSAPDRILCLTFTKAAAANMKARVFETLSGWTMMEDADLDIAIKDLSGSSPTTTERNRARELFTRALDTPGGLKILTIHAYCESLLHQFPIEANVPGHFTTIQDTDQANLLEEARAHVLSGQVDGLDIDGIYARLSSVAADLTIDNAISELVASRSKFSTWVEDKEDTEILKALRLSFGLDENETETGLLEIFVFSLSEITSDLQSIASIASESGKQTDQKLAAALGIYLDHLQPVNQRFDSLRAALLTQKDTPRKSFATKFVSDLQPSATEILQICAGAMLSTLDQVKTLQLLAASEDLFTITREIIKRYELLKRSRGLIDFNDQIEKAYTLLYRPDIRDWVRYKLDRGIDHVLVDEAQDTSPKQWKIINAITEDFHSGETASLINRTVFVVGDEKQSIYSFQGADPREFASQNKELKDATARVSKHLKESRLTLSFRSTPDVLHAVDKVFSSQQARKGLSQIDEKPVHDSIRSNDPGEVQIWPLFAKEQQKKVESWTDAIDHLSGNDPAILLAKRISEKIAQWIGKPLPGSAKPLQFKDILVLVRKRDHFITALTRTMKDMELRVAGADRLQLNQHIAIEDLIAIGQMALLPRDDLTLACVLKSPLFGWCEEDLFKLCFDRQDRTLYAMLNHASENDANPLGHLAKTALDQVNAIIRESRQRSVFDFFAWLLGPFGGRDKILARLGSEAEDVLDAFLEEAIGFERDNQIGLEAFIALQRSADKEIKREVDLERDEVRILTVHASKGLEARVVFLVDPCNAVWTEKLRPSVLDVNLGAEQGYLWLPNSDLHTSATREISSDIKEAATEEYHRLLYVGMTRAADRLIVCGYRGVKEPADQHWHRLVYDALEPEAEPLVDEIGEEFGLRWSENFLDTVTNPEPGEADEEETRPCELPEWTDRQLSFEPPLPRPLSPAGAFALIEGKEPIRRSPDTLTFDSDPAYALKRGTYIHKLLQYLPGLEPATYRETALAYLERQAPNWSISARESVLLSVLGILEAKEFAHFFSTGSKAEIAIAGKLVTQSGVRMISGQIDRLCVSENSVTVLDYKTNRDVPDSPQNAPVEYITQLSLYRELVQQIYPDRNVECALLWTNVPQLMVIPNALMDTAVKQIKKI
ncbi:MAG: double-strand break repair helicase AddA [Pseudomonadota bacterium]